jgi:hypothetical protein
MWAAHYPVIKTGRERLGSTRKGYSHKLTYTQIVCE